MAFATPVHVNNLFRIDWVIFVRIDNNAEKTRICVDETSMVSKYEVIRNFMVSRISKMEALPLIQIRRL